MRRAIGARWRPRRDKGGPSAPHGSTINNSSTCQRAQFVESAELDHNIHVLLAYYFTHSSVLSTPLILLKTRGEAVGKRYGEERGKRKAERCAERCRKACTHMTYVTWRPAREYFPFLVFTKYSSLFVTLFLSLRRGEVVQSLHLRLDDHVD